MTPLPWAALVTVIALVVIAMEVSPELGGGLLGLVVLAALMRYRPTVSGTTP